MALLQLRRSASRTLAELWSLIVPDHRIDEELRVLGTWFLPGSRRRVPGTFTWKNGNATVELHGPLEVLKGRAAPAEEHAVVHGNLYTGERATLLNAFDVTPRAMFSSQAKARPQRLISSHVAVGAHLWHESKFSRLSAQVPGLEHWLLRPWINPEVSRGQGGLPSVLIKANYPAPTSFPIPGGKVLLSLDVRPDERQQGGIAIFSMGRVTVVPDRAEPFEWLLEQLSRLTSLLTMMAGGPISTNCITVQQPGTEAEASVLISLRNAAVSILSSERQFFLSERSLEAAFEDLVSKWFECIESVDLPSRLAVDVLNSRGSSYTDFLAVMQALEGFHRGRHYGCYMSAGDYQKVQAQLCGCIPTSIGSDHKAALKSRIRYGNEHSLDKRLNELVDELPDSMRQVVIGAKRLPRLWIDTRNAYTHWEKAALRKAIDGRELHNANQRLRMLLRVSYLRLVGVPDSAIAGALRGGSRISHELRQLPAPN
jgi:hypothetical protein